MMMVMKASVSVVVVEDLHIGTFDYCLFDGFDGSGGFVVVMVKAFPPFFGARSPQIWGQFFFNSKSDLVDSN